MPSRIDRIFADARARGDALLMPFLAAGDPSLAATGEALSAVDAAGAGIVEIGFPFSDPIADGPVIAAAMHRALDRGASPRAVFELVAARRSTIRAGLVAMVSTSIVHRLGTEAFVRDATTAGFDGVILPDLDVDEAESIARACDAHDLALSLLVAPTTRPDRLARIVPLCRGFIYLLARVGITGESTGTPEVTDRVAALRRITALPIAVGFGIGTAEQVAAATAHADAAIVGSALVRRMADADDPAAAAGQLVAELAGGLRRGRPPAR